MDNHKKYKEILIHIAGTTPQLITETLYGLLHKPKPVYIDELKIITTTAGKKRIEEELIKKGRLKTFCKEFNIALPEPEFLLIRDIHNNPLEDIRDEKDNDEVGDFITGIIKEGAKDKSARLHCSLAGGRKTMSFYIGSALQIFGRPWDRLYHVLITPEFESHPDFYYKPAKDKIISNKNKEPLNTKNAEIFLIELPFIRFGDKLSLGGKSFRELVKEGQAEIDTAVTQPYLTANLTDRSLTIGKTVIKFPPLQMILYLYLIKRKTECCDNKERVNCIDCTACFLMLNDELLDKKGFEIILHDYAVIYGKNSLYWENLSKRGIDGMGKEKIRELISKLNRQIKNNLSEDISPYFIITSLRKYGGTRYGIRADKTRITIKG